MELGIDPHRTTRELKEKQRRSKLMLFLIPGSCFSRPSGAYWMLHVASRTLSVIPRAGCVSVLSVNRSPISFHQNSILHQSLIEPAARMFGLMLDHSRVADRRSSTLNGDIASLPSFVLVRVFVKSRFARSFIAADIIGCRSFSHNLKERRKSPVMRSTGD